MSNMIAFDVPIPTAHGNAEKRASVRRRTAHDTALMAGARDYSTGDISVLMVRSGVKPIAADELSAVIAPVRRGISEALGRDDRGKSVKWLVGEQRTGGPSVLVRIWRHHF